jgi:hypothetical protein
MEKYSYILLADCARKKTENSIIEVIALKPDESLVFI